MPAARHSGTVHGNGLGPESYALIEQGRIGQILSSRPTDRRAIIEEAAGITKFKTKKRLAEARLEDAKLNLSPHQRHFRRSHAADEFAEAPGVEGGALCRLREEMRAKLRIVLASKFAQSNREAPNSIAQLNRLPKRCGIATEAVHELEAEHSERTQRGYAIETELRENRDRMNADRDGDRPRACAAPAQ